MNLNPYDICMLLIGWMAVGALFSWLGPARNITQSSQIFGSSLIVNLIVYPVMWFAWPLFAIIGYFGPLYDHSPSYEYDPNNDDGDDGLYRSYVDDDL